MYKIISLSLAFGFVSSYSVPTDRYKVGTENGENYYAFEVNGATDEFYDTQLSHWGEHMCPQGYRVADKRLDSVRHGALRTDAWYEVTIACPVG